jgi:probable metal-binding protein
MHQSIHGHQVMEIVADSEIIYTKQALIAEISAQFGEDARFHTCMDSDLTADQLILLLSSKGKFVETSEGISLSEAHHC